MNGLAAVNEIEACPRLAVGEGSFVTGRFVTRRVESTVELELEDGTTIEGTTVHLIWSVDRSDWVPLGKLVQGERLLSETGPVSVAEIRLHDRPTSVYNLEVHGEHVYQVGDLGVLVHNACGHYASWTLYGKRGAILASGDELSGVEFALRGMRLSFPEQSWFGHTEGKIIDELWDLLRPGTVLSIEGRLPPCSNCRSIMQNVSFHFKNTIEYVAEDGRIWTWFDGVFQ